MNVAAPETPRGLSRTGNLMVWLGGGSWQDIDDHAERSAYSSTGLLVALNAAFTFLIVSFGLAGLAEVHLALALPFAALCAVLVAVFGRVLATSSASDSVPGRRAGEVSRVLVAVLIGVLAGELAVLAIFTGPVNRELNAQVDAARAGVAQSERGRQLEQARTDRANLDRRVNDAIARRDQARVVARCEYNPTPDCPEQTITGDPGRGDEAAQADQALVAAEGDLADARQERTTQTAALDQRITTLEGQLDGDRAAAESLARADSGIDARWRAMHDYTTDNFAALLLRFAVVAFFVVLNLLPLILRLWRGQTAQDRRIAARRLRDQAEIDADTAVAVRRAEVRAAIGLREQDELLFAHTGVRDAERPALTTATAERADTRQLPVAEEVSEETKSDNLPVLVGDRALPALAGSGSGELVPTARQGELEQKSFGPLGRLPGPLPRMARAMTALVPEPVSRLAANPPTPAKVARTLLEEVEEFSFSLTRKRKVTVTEEKPSGEPLTSEKEELSALHRSAVASRILDDAGRGKLTVDASIERPELSADDLRTNRELPLGDEPIALPRTRQRTLAGRRRRALPAGARRALPPAEGDER